MRDPATLFAKRPPVRFANTFDPAACSLEDAIRIVRESDPRHLCEAERECWQRALDAGEIWKMPVRFTQDALRLIERGEIQKPRRSYSALKTVGRIVFTVALLALPALFARADQAPRFSPCRVNGQPVDCQHFLSSNPDQMRIRNEWLRHRIERDRRDPRDQRQQQQQQPEPRR